MKKILVLIMALVMIVTVLALVGCGGNTETSATTESTTTQPGETTTTPGTTTVAPITTTTPISTTVATPNTKDPAKEYHIEATLVPTNSKELDADYKIMSTAGANLNERYADGTGVIAYVFDVSEMIEPTIVFKVRQQYLVYVTDNAELDYTDMTVVANFEDTRSDFPASAFDENGEYTLGTNITDVVVDPYELGYYGTFYVFIMNSRPEGGHGGTVMSFTINQYVEGKGAEQTVIDNSPGTPNWKDGDAIQVEDIIYTNGNDEDLAYIHVNTSSATEDKRYCDGTSFIVYRINLRNMIEPTIELKVHQNYKIEISADGENWYEIANWATSDAYNEEYQTRGSDPNVFNPSGDYLPGDNEATIVIDPYNPGIDGVDGFYGNLYIRISDCFPDAGWGGAIRSITIKHYGLVEEDED